MFSKQQLHTIYFILLYQFRIGSSQGKKAMIIYAISINIIYLR